MNDFVYFINMICVSDDYIEVQTRDRDSVVKWLKMIDHEGSSWTVLQVERGERAGLEPGPGLIDITDEIMTEYGAAAYG